LTKQLVNLCGDHSGDSFEDQVVKEPSFSTNHSSYRRLLRLIELEYALARTLTKLRSQKFWKRGFTSVNV